MRRLGRGIWEFVNPTRTAGRLPLGRIAIVAQIVGAAIFLGYTFIKKDIGFPFKPEPYTVQVEFPDAKGLDSRDEPAAAVAGSPVGRVTDVSYENGTAIATLDLDSDIEGKLFADATAQIRPASALQNLLVNIDPGSPDAGPLPGDEPIPPERTSSFVSIDELTSAFDADTQAYLQILLTEAERALRGNGGRLRRAIGELGELTDTVRPVAHELAERRELLTALVGHLDETFSTVSLRGEQLGTAVDAGSRTLAVTAARQAELAEATRLLGPVVSEARRSLRAARGITEPLAPALERLGPASSTLALTAKRTRGLIRRAGVFIGQTDDLTLAGARPLSILATSSRDLGAAASELVPVAKDLNFRAALFDQYKGGLPQLADVLSGAFSTSDNGGIFGQVDVLKFEAATAENFGFDSFAARSPKGGGPSLLERKVAEALELSCRVQDPAACVMRFAIEGLPKQPVLAPLDEGKHG